MKTAYSECNPVSIVRISTLCMKPGIINVRFNLCLLLATGNSETSRIFWLGRRTNMPTQQPRAINKNNRSSSETVELLRVWHSQELHLFMLFSHRHHQRNVLAFFFFSGSFFP